MAKKFSEQEKEIIRNKLLEHGKKLFVTYGLNKTSIYDLTKRAGIAQGTFYLFFSSKEELFFDIIEVEEEKAKERLLSEAFQSENLTKDGFKRFLYQSIFLLNDHPILRLLYEEEVMERLLRKLPPEKIAQHTEKDVIVALPFIRTWQEKGVLKKINPELIVSMIRALILITLQRKFIGEEWFEETMEQFVEMMTEGLFREDVQGD